MHYSTTPWRIWSVFNAVWVDSCESRMVSARLWFCVMVRSVTCEGAGMLHGRNVLGLRLLTLLGVNPVSLSLCHITRQEEE